MCALPQRRQTWHLSPGQVLLLYYGLAILLGGALLQLPLASNGQPLSFLDAVFTATSAQCVTGLVVVDTGSHLSWFGQCVVLLLIQTGGLGITTFSVYLLSYLGGGMSLRGRQQIEQTLLPQPYASVQELISKIFLLTIAIEGIGAALLAIRLVPQLGLAQGLWSALFHSISAFCNAGFSLFSDSMIGFQSDPLVNLTIMGLITSGGLGFLVLQELLGMTRKREHVRRRLSLHSRLVLVTSLVLTLGGALLLALLEFPGELHKMSVGNGFWMVLFQSVTARTAGFNSIDLNLLEVPSLVLIMFLMFIGASPGSCGGGIKTTSFALLFAIIHSRLKGDRHTNIFRRTVPEELTTRAMTLVLLSVVACGAAIFLLLAVQVHGLPAAESRNALLDYTFEAVSAFATVGLSLGVTAKLVPLGKLIVIVMMFIGRVGILTLAFAIIRRSGGREIRYAEEQVMIG
ncbi:potassium transporter [Geothermobacter hydrogeniphilus]|uniref:Potassium transporter n=1 Tax=Geothermobacter hydrogeniphilus TaxID=1969733 RepID=A0A2K2HEW1_9BACT|nr:TrkH family potassium uptake protein [Geothermobacter hydrogeniphilus]PNU21835.1 potassium transporter [Geothermobacter hydrogeniphilus]